MFSLNKYWMRKVLILVLISYLFNIDFKVNVLALIQKYIISEIRLYKHYNF